MCCFSGPGSFWRETIRQCVLPQAWDPITDAAVCHRGLQTLTLLHCREAEAQGPEALRPSWLPYGGFDALSMHCALLATQCRVPV